MQIVDLKHPDKAFSLTACGLCLGNFDGVHRGHRALIKELQKQNDLREERLPLGAILFTKPPSALLAGKAVPQLNTMEEKLTLLKEAGLRFVIFYDFQSIMHYTPDEFVQKILIGECNCRLAVCGFNYSYGAKGAGDSRRLAETFGTQPGRTLSVVPEVVEDGRTVSSSAIRQLLERGYPEEAARLLGRPFFISGKVQDGKRVGRRMGYPTANLLFPKGGLVPAFGVYLTAVRVGKRDYYGVTNVGIRPTFEDGEEVNCETFLLHFNGDLYGKELRVSFLRFLRPERQFASVQDLEEQIGKDVKRATEYIND